MKDLMNSLTHPRPPLPTVWREQVLRVGTTYFIRFEWYDIRILNLIVLRLRAPRPPSATMVVL